MLTVLAFTAGTLPAYPLATHYGLALVDPDNQRIVLLASDRKEILPGTDGLGTYVTVSPDQRHLLFKRIMTDGTQQPIQYDIGRRTPIILHPAVPQCGEPSMAQTGRVVFTIGSELWVVDSGRTRKLELGTYANWVPVSPDGRHAVHNDDRDQIWEIELTTGRRECLTDGQCGYCLPIWSPNSRYLVYSSLDGRLFVFDHETRATTSLGTGITPVWHPSSELLAFCRLEVQGMEMKGAELVLARPDGSTIAPFTATTLIHEAAPCFLDERRLAYTSFNDASIRCTEFSAGGLFANHEEILGVLPPADRPGRSPVSAPAGRDSLDVPYLHQVYDTPDWHNGHWSCAPTTAMMAIAYYRKLPEWKCTCSYPYAHTSHFGNYICSIYHYRGHTYSDTARDAGNQLSWGGYGYMWYDGYSPYSRMDNYLDYHGLTTWNDDTATWNETVAEVQAGYPYPMCVALTTSGHLVLAIGQVSNWHTLIFNDPYGNKNTPGYPSYDGKYARYDWPGYNNGYANLNQVHWCRGARGTMPAPCDTIVDDLQFRYHNEPYGCYLFNDPPSTMRYYRDALAGWNGHCWWTYSTNAADTCYVTWTPHLPCAGDYEVFAYIPSTNAQAQARYVVHYAGGTATVTVNQAAHGDTWVSLGTYAFNTTGSYVYCGDATGTAGQRIAFDAVRWSFRETAIAAPDPGPGCNAPFGSSLVRNQWQVFLPNAAGPVAVILRDAAGRVVLERRFPALAGRQSLTLDVTPLPSGVYFWCLRSGTREHYGRMVKIR